MQAKIGDAPREVLANEVLNAILRHGTNSTCFLTLYQDFKYLSAPKHGVLAYIDTPTAWIGAADPLAPLDSQMDVVRDFVAGARMKHKSAALLPTSKALAERARSEGLYAVQIGSEPWFSLKDFSLSSFIKGIPVARRFMNRGGAVESFSPLNLSDSERAELELIVDHWLDSRPSVPLSFLNRVEPWLYASYKRYFRALYHGQTMGFIAAVPVPARNAWYLVDLIRLPDAPVGTTELLVAEAMEQLKREGAAQVTLGMAPLVPVGRDERKHHPSIYPVLEFVFHKSEAFYGFQSLHDYKQKLHPTHWEPLYLIASPSMNVNVSYGLFRALFPKGLWKTAGALVVKKLSKFQIPISYPTLLSQTIVPRSPPASIIETIARCRITLTLFWVNILLFMLSTDTSVTQLRPLMEERYAYSLLQIKNHPLQIENYILPAFLHWNRLHLLGNLALLILFGGMLEIVAGSVLFTVCYLAAILLANPLTSLFGFAALTLKQPDLLTSFMLEKDIGASLGIFACMGALAHFLRYTRWLCLAALLGIAGVAWQTSSVMQFNHLVAFSIGIVIARAYAPKI